MIHTLLRAGAVLALGSFAFAGPAPAASPLPLNDTARLVIPVGDIENEEVGHDLEPDVTLAPSEMEKGEAPKGATEPPKEEGSGGSENEEVWHDLRPDVTPPGAAVGE